MSDDVQTSATISSLREQVDRLTDYNQRLLAENVQLTNRQTMDREEIESMATRNDELRADLANARKWIDGNDVRSDFPNATAMRQALDRERERCGVLEREVRAYREWQRTKCDDNSSSLDHWHACKALDAATLETDTRHALDAAKFGGA